MSGLGFIIQKKKALSFTLYSDTNRIFFAPKWSTLRFFGVVGSTCQCVIFVLFCFTQTMSVNMKCAGELLSTVSSVCSNTQQLVFMEARKPSIGLFHYGSILSFAVVQGNDPESFVCNWIPMQMWSCNHLLPHHCWVEGQPGRDNWRAIKSLNVSAQPWESKGTMVTRQICAELFLHLHELNWAIHGCLGVYL